MASILTSLSDALAAAINTAAPSVVQVHGGRRLAAGVVAAPGLVVTSGRGIDATTVSVRDGEGRVLDGTVIGRGAATGFAVIRVADLAAPAATVADEPRPGHLAQALGRTWSGGVFAAFAPVSVVGGPLRTGRRTELARVIRVGVTPHGALTGGALVDGEGRVLGVVTGTAIRGTTVVVPASIAWAEVQDVVAHEGAAPGYLGIGSVPVRLAAAQQADGRTGGLLVTAVADGGPAAAAGVLVGDVVVTFDGAAVDDPEDLVARLRGRAGHTVPLTVVRGGVVAVLTATVGTRPRG